MAAENPRVPILEYASSIRPKRRGLSGWSLGSVSLVLSIFIFRYFYLAEHDSESAYFMALSIALAQAVMAFLSGVMGVWMSYKRKRSVWSYMLALLGGGVGLVIAGFLMLFWSILLNGGELFTPH